MACGLLCGLFTDSLAAQARSGVLCAVSIFIAAYRKKQENKRSKKNLLVNELNAQGAQN